MDYMTYFFKEVILFFFLKAFLDAFRQDFSQEARKRKVNPWNSAKPYMERIFDILRLFQAGKSCNAINQIRKYTQRGQCFPWDLSARPENRFFQLSGSQTWLLLKFPFAWATAQTTWIWILMVRQVLVFFDALQMVPICSLLWDPLLYLLAQGLPTASEWLLIWK